MGNRLPGNPTLHSETQQAGSASPSAWTPTTGCRACTTRLIDWLKTNDPLQHKFVVDPTCREKRPPLCAGTHQYPYLRAPYFSLKEKPGNEELENRISLNFCSENYQFHRFRALSKGHFVVLHVGALGQSKYGDMIDAFLCAPFGD